VREALRVRLDELGPAGPSLLPLTSSRD
jgi:hypothetical protein